METCDTELNKHLIGLNAQAMSTRDRQLFDQTVAEDVVRHCQAAPQPLIRSRDDLWNFMQTDWAAFPDARIVPQQILAEGDRVAVFARYEGTQSGPLGPFPPSGRRVCVDIAAFFRIDAGKIAEIWTTWDNLSVLSQLGHIAIPEPAAPVAT
jgi:steroid delta-isomerase-like uncharacterized protein